MSGPALKAQPFIEPVLEPPDMPPELPLDASSAIWCASHFLAPEAAMEAGELRPLPGGELPDEVSSPV